MSQLLVTVIVATKNSQETVGMCLDLIRRNNPVEIIVVDGNSTDRTVEIAQKYTTRILSDNGLGLSYARQLGAAAASQEYLIYLNPDVILVTDDALATMLREFTASSYVAMHARSIDLNVSPSRDYWYWAQQKHYAYSEAISGGNHLGLMACIIKRKTVLHYGFDLYSGLDGMSEDKGLQLKLKRAGYRFGTSSAGVHHIWETDLGKLVRHRRFDGAVNLRFYIREGPWNLQVFPFAEGIFWVLFSMAKRNPRLIPYFALSTICKLTGMVLG